MSDKKILEERNMLLEKINQYELELDKKNIEIEDARRELDLIRIELYDRTRRLELINESFDKMQSYILSGR